MKYAIIIALLMTAQPGQAMEDVVDFSSLCNEGLPNLFPLLKIVPLESIGNNADAPNLVTPNPVQNNASNPNPVTANPVAPKDNKLHTTLAKVIVKKSHPRAQYRPGVPDEQGNKWYDCRYCGKKFSTHTLRWSHEHEFCPQAKQVGVALKKNKEPRPGIPDEQEKIRYPCRYCEKKFSAQSGRWRHEHAYCPQAKEMDLIATADDPNHQSINHSTNMPLYPENNDAH